MSAPTEQPEAVARDSVGAPAATAQDATEPVAGDATDPVAATEAGAATVTGAATEAGAATVTGAATEASAPSIDTGTEAPQRTGTERAPPHLLESAAVRARKRPRALLLLWGWELMCAAIIATPIHAWALRVWGAHPDGDAVIFRPGGHALLAWLGDETPALAIVLRTSLLLLVTFGILGQIITGATVASLATGTGTSDDPPPTSFALRVGATSFFPLLGISVIAGAIQGFFLGVGLFASSAADHALQTKLGDARSFMVRLVVLAIFLVPTAMAGVMGDLGRVALVRDIAGDTKRHVTLGRRMRDGIVAAVRASRRVIGRATMAWGWRAALSVALVCVGSVAGDLVGGRGGGALWMLFAFHQLVVLGRAGLRTSWLANALRFVR